MSLILDALRKADSERERGSVPGLHAHPVEALAAETPQPPVVTRWQWAIVSALAVLAIAVVWYVAGRDAPPHLAEPAPVTAAPPAPTAAPTSTAPAASTNHDASPAPGGVAAPAPGSAETMPVAEPAPWPQPARRKLPQAPVAATTPPAKNDAKTIPPASAAPAEPPIYAREQLPQNIQAELPSLTIGGSIYSPNPPDRSLIVNGRLFRENQQLTAGLSLEQIRQKSAVLRYKGYRFEIMF